ncbi:MAG TPA: hypothetical protein EYP10_04735 [Armatimonadetes bacterium]|nr:hypothetical protein [Armatimonadota bacterium]
MPKGQMDGKRSKGGKRGQCGSSRKVPARHECQVPEHVLKHLEETFEPLNDWLAQMSQEWSKLYPGKYLGIIEVGHCKFKLAFVADSEDEAYERFEREYPEQIPTVVYVPTKGEMEMVL